MVESAGAVHAFEEAEAVLAPWLEPAEIAALRAAGTLG